MWFSQWQQGTRGSACVEGLERRLCMDGAVRAAVVDGDLMLSGDDDDNQILVYPIDGNTVCVMGLDGTKVNGKRSRWFANIFDDLEIRMRQGGEELVVKGGDSTARRVRSRARSDWSPRRSTATR